MSQVMNTSIPHGFLAAFAVAAVLHAAGLRVTRGVRHGDSDRWPDVVGVAVMPALLIATGITGRYQHTLPQGPWGFGPSLEWLVVASLPVIAAGLWSDRRAPRSERHALGLVAGGVAMALLGFPIWLLSNPFVGTMDVAPVMQVIVTTLWLLLLAAIVELVSLVPYAVALFPLALTGAVIASGGAQQTTASHLLMGIAAGAVAGRVAASFLPGRWLPFGKGEVFALGLWLTAMTNVAFLKGVAFAGFVLPVAAAALVLIALGVQAFERSLLLRPAPRHG